MSDPSSSNDETTAEPTGAPPPGSPPPSAPPPSSWDAPPPTAEMPPPPAAEVPPAGPPPGQQQAWGTAAPQWTPPSGGGYAPATVPGGGYPLQSDERTNAMWSHLGSLLVNWLVSCGLLGWIVPLIIRNGAGARSQFARFHATESLNFSITVAIASVVTGLSMLLLIGFLLFPVVVIGALVLQIIATIKANNGEWYRYPINIRMISD